MTSPAPAPGRALVAVLLVVALAAPAIAAAIAVLKPPQQTQVERIRTDQGQVTIIYRPTVSTRELGCKPYRGTVIERYYYRVMTPEQRPSHLVAGMEVVTSDSLGRIKAYFLKALPGAKARAVGNRKVGRYIITRDKGNEAIVIEAQRPAAGKQSTVKMRRVVQGKLDLTPTPTPQGQMVE